MCVCVRGGGGGGGGCVWVLTFYCALVSRYTCTHVSLGSENKAADHVGNAGGSGDRGGGVLGIAANEAGAGLLLSFLARPLWFTLQSPFLPHCFVSGVDYPVGSSLHKDSTV